MKILATGNKMKVCYVFLLFFTIMNAGHSYYYDEKGYEKRVYSGSLTRGGDVIYTHSIDPKSPKFMLSDFIIVEFTTAVHSELIEIYEQKYDLKFETHPLGNQSICKFRVQNKKVSIETANKIMENEAVRSSYPDWIMLVR